MAGTPTPIFPQTINSGVQTFVNADSTNLKTLYTAATNGSRVNMIMVSSTDTSARDMSFWVTKGGTDYLLATVSIPANSGNTNAISLVTVLDHTRFGTMKQDSNGNRYIDLANGEVLKSKVGVAVTTAKTIYVRCETGDY